MKSQHHQLALVRVVGRDSRKGPWYSNVAPASWLVQRDVDEGRQRLDFSEWDHPQERAGEVVEAVQEGDMPPIQYRLLHPGARLSSTERQTLVQRLQATFGPGQGGNTGQ